MEDKHIQRGFKQPGKDRQHKAFQQQVVPATDTYRYSSCHAAPLPRAASGPSRGHHQVEQH
jgi:hypothetical protein